MIKCMGIKDFGPSGSDPAHIESNRGCKLAKGSRTGLWRTTTAVVLQWKKSHSQWKISLQVGLMPST